MNWIIIMFIIIFLLNNKNRFLSSMVLLGSIVIISCDHFFILYLGLELQTFSLFILISKRKNLKGAEGGLKYFILGALSSGIFLLGISIIFINGYSLEIKNLIFYKKKILNLAFIIIVFSLFFKISLFPLHFWIPDIYEGSSWKTLGLIGTLPKISIIFFLIKFKLDISIICALFSIIIGTLGALNQTKIKRLLAYSGISHIGFIILVLNILNQKNILIVNIYLFIYIISFIFIILISISFNPKYLIELSNNQYSNKIIGFSWIIILLSMGGIPPLSGFISKWLVLWVIIEENYIFSSIICIIFSVISVGYYLRLIKIIYFQKNSSFFLFKTILIQNNLFYYSLGIIIYFNLILILNPSLFLLI
uniref:NADH dehydrogenase subunit 2 n=1 Tax=Bargmannia lata TaxID=2078594 RepID=UPI0026E2D658|nr:NADH dehydrogenase subunit 2 [Bargmannia lata]WJJ70062.1 NADH dehydrogenase subunit 2 [Bargmannia lata]